MRFGAAKRAMKSSRSASANAATADVKLFNKHLFQSAEKCQRLGWFMRRDMGPKAEFSSLDYFLMTQGRKFEERVYLECFKWSTGDDSPSDTACVTEVDPSTASVITKELMLPDSGINTLLQPTFVSDRSEVARGDAARRKDDGSWELIEIKSSSDKNYKKHIPDLAFTVKVANSASSPDRPMVTSSTLICVDSSYILGGSSASTLHKEIDCTQHVEAHNAKKYKYIEELREETATLEPPPPVPNTSCGSCGLFSSCVGSSSPSHPLWDFKNLSPKRFSSLISSAPSLEVADCDRDDLTNLQKLHYDAVVKAGPVVKEKVSAFLGSRSGKIFTRRNPSNPYTPPLYPNVLGHIQELLSQLNSVTSPVFYLDFESVNLLDPPYDGMTPYETYVTQFSLHSIDSNRPCSASKRSSLHHVEYLAEPERDCREELLLKLLDCIGDAGSIVVYSSYEKTQLKKLMTLYPQHAPLVERAISRLFDLEKLIKQNVRMPAFRGRSSIKVVLPALCPNFSSAYTDLASRSGIADGGAAIAAMSELIFRSTPDEEVANVRSALLEYCKLDSLAMVEIHAALFELLGRQCDHDKQ